MVARLPKTGWFSLAIFLKCKVASPEQTTPGKDKSNPCLAVMTCPKSAQVQVIAAVFVAVSILKLTRQDLSRN
ncbi:hypothetical protein Tco_0702490 [Tanacetum coccineum]|uniref:Secreted protein n=1 Tax=Tanacetum coccineum TaxID=301880 RepID=A0ABQ4XW43_9ASTR